MYFVKLNFGRYVVCLKWVGGGYLFKLLFFYYKYILEIGIIGEYMILNLL